ncbi:HU family DNA-binding protein [Flavobacterium sp. RSB2_4_14]|uniref:HU family DNA-binding protein n=1 Tax=Flavobacterium sp. RSB2_4_14 TaxID=3447665 RepID=UPI003F3011A7
MSVKIKPVQRVNPQDVNAPQKFYAKAVADGRTDLKRLAKLIAMQCTVNRADCLAVLAALEDNIIMELQEGKIVKLGELGTFQLGVNSMGSDTSNEVGSSSVKKARLNFRPGEELKKMLKNLSFRISNDAA